VFRIITITSCAYLNSSIRQRRQGQLEDCGACPDPLLPTLINSLNKKSKKKEEQKCEGVIPADMPLISGEHKEDRIVGYVEEADVKVGTRKGVLTQETVIYI
jgi:hypothetical protein